MDKGEIIIYQTESGQTKLEVNIKDETVWLTQKAMGQLFDVESHTITYHLKEIYKSGELDENATARKIRAVQTEGKREVARTLDFYNLDCIISVGYRVNSYQATQFRIWATQRLKEYIVKGFALNDDRFKTGNSMNYFNELQ
ncbi:MAG: RhuM family protein, partial [Kiritimatiellae bacterium]|nr:RhuM family protein [Kiritimatiellia bacterium]